MEYCKRCLYPRNARPTIIFDEEGVCSGCRYHESRLRIDWDERRTWFEALITEYKSGGLNKNPHYDCIIPVSGGKDSHFQVWTMKEVYGLNPLLVTFNHIYNTQESIRNLNNIVTTFGCDLIRFTISPETARKISRYMLRRCGDITWHYHAGIMTFPFQVAVQHKIPLIVWGEHGFAELTGMVTLDDLVEFTNWKRREHDMRGIEPDSLVADPESGISRKELAPFYYPSDEDIEAVGVRGIYLSNYFDWDALKHGRHMVREFGFKTHPGPRERTFNLYAKIEDHANAVHDYQKYLKFGYGRATDDASMEIRHGRMTREEGIEMVRRYDHRRPPSLDTYLDFLGISDREFVECTCGNGMRDHEIWEQLVDGTWRARDSVVNHVNDPGVDAVRVPLVAAEERTFGSNNQGLYWSGEPADGTAAHHTNRSAADNSFIVL
ncbi:N-acetyl sugar amidotransferase [Desulfocurvibacter africanus]|uniref:N-acetyl sugar amidotransferase n=1 Tax=Desulfocurvibacter africanus TaxID=873 RepID=UPI002FD8E37E